MNKHGERIFVALDFPGLAKAAEFANPLKGKVGFKIGSELFTSAGPSAIGEIGGKIFLDLKFHDTAKTVAGAVRAATLHRVSMLTVHCLGGEEMMRAARKAADEVSSKIGQRPLLVGVTILTDQDLASLEKMGFDPNLSMEKIVAMLAILAAESGLDGVVCSPLEIAAIRKTVRDDGFVIVTPGIRKKTSPPDKQKRTMTAGEAINLGATYLVIGGPITQAPDPVAAVDEFIEEISRAA